MIGRQTVRAVALGGASIVLACGALACGGGGHAPKTSTVESASVSPRAPTSTASASRSATRSGPATAIPDPNAPELYPLDFRSGHPALDSFLDVVTGPVPTGLEELIGLVPIPCGSGRPNACPDGVAQGTPVPSFLGTGCEPRFVRDVETARKDVEAVLSGGPFRLYAAYHTQVLESGPTLTAVVLSDGESDGWRQVLLDGDAQIVGVNRFCSGTFPEWLAPPEYVVRPPGN